jgi:hypothetical protein
MLHVGDAASAQVAVLYRATSARHKSQYLELAERLGSRVRFLEEVDFRKQVIEILVNPAPSVADPFLQPASGDSMDHCLFLVDDSIFVRSVLLDNVQSALRACPDALGFSLRLGRNTTQCYSLNRPQALPRFTMLGNGVLKFRWRGSEGDFGYPLEISSSVYGLGMVRDLIRGLQFSSPSSLESQMALWARRFPGRQTSLLCCEQSVAFCIPLNRVQDAYQNRSGEKPRFSAEGLADLFDRGMRIDVHSLAGFVPSACHQEVEPEFVRDDENKHAR